MRIPGPSFYHEYEVSFARLQCAQVLVQLVSETEIAKAGAGGRKSHDWQTFGDPEYPYLGSMGIYLFKREALERLLAEEPDLAAARRRALRQRRRAAPTSTSATCAAMPPPGTGCTASARVHLSGQAHECHACMHCHRLFVARSCIASHLEIAHCEAGCCLRARLNILLAVSTEPCMVSIAQACHICHLVGSWPPDGPALVHVRTGPCPVRLVLRPCARTMRAGRDPARAGGRVQGDQLACTTASGRRSAASSPSTTSTWRWPCPTRRCRWTPSTAASSAEVTAVPACAVFTTDRPCELKRIPLSGSFLQRAQDCLWHIAVATHATRFRPNAAERPVPQHRLLPRCLTVLAKPATTAQRGEANCAYGACTRHAGHSLRHLFVAGCLLEPYCSPFDRQMLALIAV